MVGSCTYACAIGEGTSGWLNQPTRNQESVGRCRMPRTSNVRAGLRVRGTFELTDPGVRYYSNERSTGFVFLYDDARTRNRGAESSER